MLRRLDFVQEALAQWQMRAILVTGSRFVGRNLVQRLSLEKDARVIGVDIDTPAAVLEDALRQADVVVHLAGVNRPPDPADYGPGNAGLTTTSAPASRRSARALFILSSSIRPSRITPTAKASASPRRPSPSTRGVPAPRPSSFG